MAELAFRPDPWQLPRLRPGTAIGLLGGSFDPPHGGHVHISRAALTRFALDRVWWMVSPGNLDQALTYFDEEMALFEELYASYPTNVGFKNGLAISYSKLGDTHSSLGNLEKALTYFDEETALFEQLYDSYPTDVGFKKGLAISYEKLGATHSSLGNLDQALIYFDEQTALFEELYASYPTNVGFKNGLAISYAQLATFYRDQRQDNLQARHYFLQAKSLWEALVEQSPQHSEFVKYYEMVQRDIEELGGE